MMKGLNAISRMNRERIILTRNFTSFSSIDKWRSSPLSKNNCSTALYTAKNTPLTRFGNFPREKSGSNFVSSAALNFSTSSNSSQETAFTDSTMDANSVLSQMIPGSSPISPQVDPALEAANAITASEAITFSPSIFNPVDHAINILNYIDSLTGLPFVCTIVGTTMAIRTALVPLYIKSQKNASRVAHMKPEMEALKAKYDKLGGTKIDIAQQQQMNAEMFALFKKFECNPMFGFVLPLAQAPVFISMFFALQKMPLYFSETMSHGGAFWFPDLTVPDPMYALPVVSSAIFIATIELGKKNMAATSNPAQANMMLTVFRGLGLLMIPITINFPSAVLCYWVTNNTYTFFLSAAFQQKVLRDAVGIWEMPKPVPGAPAEKGLQEMLKEAIAKNHQIAEMSEKEEQLKKMRQLGDEQTSTNSDNELMEAEIVGKKKPKQEAKQDDNR